MPPALGVIVDDHPPSVLAEGLRSPVELLVLLQEANYTAPKVSVAQICTQCKQPLAEQAKFCASCGQAVVALRLIFGDYEATEMIGEGGMGRVYKATQRRLNRQVCIKTLLPQFASDPEISARFAKEATTTAVLSHPNIVSIFDVGSTPEGVAYMVMELIDGKQLRSIIRDEAPVPAARAVMLIDQVLAALAEAHTHAVVHRDLKPANVLVVAQRDGTELCKLLDFGIARVTSDSDERLTRAGMMVGTPGYMAPEQIVGDETDHRADLYAVGATLYELLCGERVVVAANDLERFKKVLSEDPLAPSLRTRSSVPAALDAVCLKALSRKAEARYASAGDFRDALAKAMRSISDPAGGSTTGTSFGGQIDYSPLASAMAPGSSSTGTVNDRALVAAVLVSTDGWERSQLMEPLDRLLRESMAAGNFKLVRGTITGLQDELKAKGPSENLKVLFEMIHEMLSSQLPLLFDWLSGERRAAARWLLLLLGTRAVDLYLRELPGLEPAVQPHLVEVLRVLDPDSRMLLAYLQRLDLPALQQMLVSARNWSGDYSAAMYNMALQSGEATVRRLALESLDEASAFRFGVVVRQRLHDVSLTVRTEALRWVLVLEDDAAVPELGRLLQRSSVLPPERKAVWRTLGKLKTDAARAMLVQLLDSARDLGDVAELARVLVRTKTVEALNVIRERIASSEADPKRKAVLEEALRAG